MRGQWFFGEPETKHHLWKQKIQDLVRERDLKKSKEIMRQTLGLRTDILDLDSSGVIETPSWVLFRRKKVVRKDVIVPRSSSINLLYKRTLPWIGISSRYDHKFVE